MNQRFVYQPYLVLIGITLLILGVSFLKRQLYAPNISTTQPNALQSCPSPVHLNSVASTEVPIYIALSVSRNNEQREYIATYFKISLPEGWELQSYGSNTVTETLESATFIAGKSTYRIGTGDFTPGQASIRVDIARPSGGETGDEKSFEKKQITFNGREATHRIGYGGIADSVYTNSIEVYNNGKIYKITLLTQDEDLKEQFASEFEKIISTFRFIN